ncbi:MAG: hypothetical protein RL748_459 [Pseudomonadota bacterium]
MKHYGMLLMALVLLGCGERSAYEEKAEANAKARAEENKAAHEKREKGD